MNRRQAIKLMAAVPVVGVLPSVAQGEENKLIDPCPFITLQYFIDNKGNNNNLPVIKFQNSDYISNIDELFIGVEWKEKTNKYRQVLAWLPEDRAMKAILGDCYFYGEVLVSQTQGHMLEISKFLGLDENSVSVSKTEKSTIALLPSGVLFFPGMELKKVNLIKETENAKK